MIYRGLLLKSSAIAVFTLETLVSSYSLFSSFVQEQGLSLTPLWISLVTCTNFVVGTEFGCKLVPCLFVSRETTVILNESEIWSRTERDLDYNQSGIVAVLMLLHFLRVLLLRCLCVRTEAWEDFS